MMLRKQVSPRRRFWLLVVGYLAIALVSAAGGAVWAVTTNAGDFANRYF